MPNSATYRFCDTIPVAFTENCSSMLIIHLASLQTAAEKLFQIRHALRIIFFRSPALPLSSDDKTWIDCNL